MSDNVDSCDLQTETADTGLVSDQKELGEVAYKTTWGSVLTSLYYFLLHILF